jgi:hypothetical protein
MKLNSAGKRIETTALKEKAEYFKGTSPSLYFVSLIPLSNELSNLNSR